MKINFEKLKQLSSTGLVLIMLSSPIGALADKIHIVKKGDTLYGLSKDNYNNINYYDELANYNNINNARLIRVGDMIYIPSLKKLLNASNYAFGYYTFKKGDTLYEKCKEYYEDGSLASYIGEYNDISNYKNIQIGTIVYFPSLNEILDYKKACHIEGDYNTHIVKKGETLSSISYKYYGNIKYYKEIGDFNGITDYDMIIAGTTLYIPNLQKQKVLGK